MKQLAEYNSQIISMYAQGDSVDDIATKLEIPEGHVRLIVKMVFNGIDESRATKVSKQAHVAEVEKVAAPKVKKTAVKADTEKKQDNAAKLAKLVGSRSKKTLETIVAKIKNEELKYIDRDKAMLSLKIIFDSNYREQYAFAKSIQNWREALDSTGKGEAAKESSKTEMQAVERAERYFATVVKAEAEKRHKKVIPAYDKEIA